MSASSIQRHLLVAAIAGVLALGPAADAFAQTAAERAAERRAARQAALEGGEKDTRKGAAAEEYPDATRKEPGLRSSSRLGPRINKVSAAQQEGDLAAAEAAAKDILENDKANAYERAITLRLLADLLIDTDNDRARNLLREAIELDGLGNNDHYGSMLALAQLQMQDDDYAGGLATLDRLVNETKTDKAEVQVLRGNALYRLERYDEAIAALEPVVKGNPEARADWNQLLMASYAESGRGSEATALAEQVAAKTPDDKRAQLNLANVYLQADDYPNAIAVYERLRSAGELTDERDYSNLSALYLNSDNGEAKAIEVLNEGLDKGVLKGDHRTYSSLAQAYYFTDQYDKAIEFYGKAAPLDEDGGTWLNLAKVLANEGRDAESKAAAQKALDKGLPNPEEARKLLAR
ncbi:tetratricopeptide repeat protein [Luteimonas arsenica]|uniref:tetratricopeptide repeat protein n=1 Tax=Luteimonas arsenica TaxID=1586242 RepID=UPI0010548CA4|nr:tetratricopeptide repeat protein [Luteimonas arsenica]